MASKSVFEVSIAIFCFIIFCFFFYFKKPHDIFLRNWPVLGMLPGLLMEFHQIYEFGVKILQNSNLTFTFKGPWFSGMDMLFTVDQANIHYIMISNFSNYTKGQDFKEVFDVLGDGILTAESELWKNLRKASKVMLSHQGFRRLSMSTTRKKINEGLVPLFNHFAEERTVVDLQDVFVRFMFDTTLMTVTGCEDPRSLSIEMPEFNEFAKALNDVGEGIMYRHVKPKFLWKLQRLVGFGQEKKLSKVEATLKRMCGEFISAKREKITTHITNEEAEDLLTSHMKLDSSKYELLNPSDDKFLKDTMLAFILAGRDTTASALTWFFWLLSENPQVVTKIRKEITTNLITIEGGDKTKSYYDDSMQFLNKLVYLHGALYESMRLYPPVPFERMSPINQDKLPSGHKVDPSMKVLIFTYALGRLQALWGQYALKFKPERWILETGRLREEPSFKFFVFNAGPRSCLGKHLVMTLMKKVVVEILQNYDFEVVKGQKIEPVPGPILRMKHGLRVTLTKRCFDEIKSESVGPNQNTKPKIVLD